jgi:hypothetical protein
MLVGVMSDTHDNIWRYDEAVGLLRSRGIEAIIHCGDYCAPFMFLRLEQIGVPVHCVFGNGDGDKFLMSQLAFTKLRNLKLYGDLGEITLGGRHIAFIHEPRVARGLFSTGDYDAVFYGHIHQVKEDSKADRLLICPGEVMGMKGSSNLCIYDTSKNEVEILTLGQ